MGVCSICKKSISDIDKNTTSFQNHIIPVCRTCKNHIESYDSDPIGKKEKTKMYLREQILLGKINQNSFPILDYCLGDEAEKLIMAAAQSEKTAKAKKEYYYNGTKYAIELSLAIISFIITILFYNNKNNHSLYFLIVPFVGLFCLLLSSIERQTRR